MSEPTFVMFGKRGRRKERRKEELYFANCVQIESFRKTTEKECFGSRQDVPWITMYPVDIYYEMMFNWKESGSHHSKQFPSDFLPCKSGAQKGHLWESRWNNGFPCAKWWHHTCTKEKEEGCKYRLPCQELCFVSTEGERKKKKEKETEKKEKEAKRQSFSQDDNITVTMKKKKREKEKQISKKLPYG